MTSPSCSRLMRLWTLHQRRLQPPNEAHPSFLSAIMKAGGELTLSAGLSADTTAQGVMQQIISKRQAFHKAVFLSDESTLDRLLTGLLVPGHEGGEHTSQGVLIEFFRALLCEGEFVVTTA